MEGDAHRLPWPAAALLMKLGAIWSLNRSFAICRRLCACAACKISAGLLDMAKMAKAAKLVLKSSPPASRLGRQPAADSATRLSQRAYKLILDALFHRRIAAGAFMSQGTLVELLGMPIQPLRDALRVLEVEGLL